MGDRLAPVQPIWLHRGHGLHEKRSRAGIQRAGLVHHGRVISAIPTTPTLYTISLDRSTQRLIRELLQP